MWCWCSVDGEGEGKGETYHLRTTAGRGIGGDFGGFGVLGRGG